MSFINQHSFTLFSLVIFIVMSITLLRDGVKINDLFALIALAIGLGIAFYFFRPSQSSSDEVDEIIAQIGAGQPVLLELQSDF